MNIGLKKSILLSLFSDAPVFSMKPSDVHAHSGSDVRFKCSAHGIPKPTITWSKNGGGVGGDYIVVGDGFMLVKDLVFWDAAVYQCFAENYLGKVQATANLFVYRKGNYMCTMDKIWYLPRHCLVEI